MKMEFRPASDQVAVILGANSGIGRATAERFARQGAKVVVSGRSEEAIETLAQEIRSKGGEATAIPADVNDFSQVKNLADRTIEKYGRIDSWIQTAAVTLYSRLEDINPEEFKQVIDTNLVGQAYGAMVVLPYLKKQRSGSLIMVSSVEGRKSLPYQSAYAASKHGINAFMDSLRMEVNQEKIPINIATVMPSSINTPLFEKALTKLGVQPAPVPPIYEPELAAEAIQYASEHPVRELFVGGGGKSLGLLQRLSPAISDKVALQLGQLQRTDKPKSEHAPNNLFTHLEGYDRVHGEFGKEAKRESLYTKMRMSPIMQIAAGLAAIALVGLVSSRITRSYLNGRR